MIQEPSQKIGLKIFIILSTGVLTATSVAKNFTNTTVWAHHSTEPQAVAIYRPPSKAARALSSVKAIVLKPITVVIPKLRSTSLIFANPIESYRIPERLKRRSRFGSSTN